MHSNRPSLTSHSALSALMDEVVACQKCPRLIGWCEKIAHEKRRQFMDDDYWGKPVPSFGDPNAEILIVGLAPAAHGANRTGRMFTGDRSGDWLYRAMHKAGFANQPESIHADDGLELINAWVSATAHCAPPQNKLTAQEIKNCRPYLVREIQAMQHLKVIIALGKLAFDGTLKTLNEMGIISRELIKESAGFSHGAELKVSDSLTLIGSYHPSQQNTFTKRLTEPMFDEVFTAAKKCL